MFVGTISLFVSFVGFVINTRYNTFLDLVYGKRHFVEVVWLFLVATVSWWGGRLGAALVNKRVL